MATAAEANEILNELFDVYNVADDAGSLQQAITLKDEATKLVTQAKTDMRTLIQSTSSITQAHPPPLLQGKVWISQVE